MGVGVAIAAASVVGAASGDDISNKLDLTVDAAAEIMPLTVGGPNGTTQLYVQPANGDGKNGCNLTASTTLGLSVSSSNTAVATVSPSSLTFGSCGDVKTLTVTPVGQGSATISVSQTSNDTGASFNLAPATFTVNVAASHANTAPTVAVAGVKGGAFYNKGSVPAATCEVTDAEDGNSSFPAALSAISGRFASDGIGEQTASCSYTDGGGLTAAGSETYSIVDPSAPTIGYTLSPTGPDGNNGWYKTDVGLAWNLTEPESPNSLQKTGCDDQHITSDQHETTYSCSATSAGGTDAKSVTIKRDATPPTLDGAATTPANAAGWYKGNVTVQWTAQDGLSGIDPKTAPSDSVVTGEGTNLGTGEVSVADMAGNVTTASKDGFNIDRTAPGITWDTAIKDGDSVVFGSVPAAPSCTATDSLSGPNGCTVSGYSTAVGPHTLTATAHDQAGNETVETRSYDVLAWTLKGFYQPVDMGGVVNTVKAGSTVPLKFEVFAGPTELTDVSAVSKWSVAEINPTPNAAEDPIELTATGSTSLRYDAIAGQFVYNWQTPKNPGHCYRVTMTAQDGSTLVALFKLK